jgi:hypothetical protein
VAVAIFVFQLATLAQSSLNLKDMDNVRISLLTCQPHDEVYSIYGHTAIRYQDAARGTDLAINYGMFSFNKPYFILRFVFGLTDYEMGIEPFDAFCAQYASYGSGVYEQELNLTPEEKLAIVKAIDTNYEPQNRVYRYNYFYDNCTTRAREMIVNHLQARVNYTPEKIKGTSYRQIVHQCASQTPWIRFGNDMLLGVQADLIINRSQRQFLPANLMRDFEGAMLSNGTNTKRKLVLSSGWVVKPGVQTTSSAFPLSPTALMLVLAAIILGTTAIEAKLNTRFAWFDALWLLLCGLVGLLLFVMIFSQHPTVRINFQILFFCPYTLLYIYKALKKDKEKQFFKGIKIWCILIVLFFIGRFFQHYAEGIVFLALSLLIRYLYLLYRHHRA